MLWLRTGDINCSTTERSCGLLTSLHCCVYWETKSPWAWSACWQGPRWSTLNASARASWMALQFAMLGKMTGRKLALLGFCMVSGLCQCCSGWIAHMLPRYGSTKMVSSTRQSVIIELVWLSCNISRACCDNLWYSYWYQQAHRRHIQIRQ